MSRGLGTGVLALFSLQGAQVRTGPSVVAVGSPCLRNTWLGLEGPLSIIPSAFPGQGSLQS